MEPRPGMAEPQAVRRPTRVEHLEEQRAVQVVLLAGLLGAGVAPRVAEEGSRQDPSALHIYPAGSVLRNRSVLFWAVQ